MEILGLPLHPLLVHGVVVLVPLAALGGLAIVASKWARLRYGWLVVAGAFVGAGNTFAAQKAGEDLATTRFPNPPPALQRHIDLGNDLLLWVILLFVGTLVTMIGQRMIDQDKPRGRAALLSGMVITAAMAIVCIVQTVRIGHAGSVAVWGS